VYNDQGEVLAATLAGEEGADKPVPMEGEHVDEFEVPKGLTENNLHELFEKFSVDVDTKTLKQGRCASPAPCCAPRR